MTDSQGVVIVVDDDDAMRVSLDNLARSVGLRVIAYKNARELLETVRADEPACLVLDVRLPGLSGLDLQAKLRELGIDLPIIFITGHGDIPMTVQAMKAGAVEFLSKPFRDQALLDAINQALARSRAEREARAGLHVLQERFDMLTARERSVLALVVAGHANKRIAAELGASEATIKIHRQHVMQKMKAASLPELVRMADRLCVSLPSS